MVPPIKKKINTIKKNAPNKKIARVASKLALEGVRHPVKKAEELTNWQKFRKGKLDPDNSFGKTVGGYFGGGFGSELGGRAQGLFRSITGWGDYRIRAKKHGGKFSKSVMENHGGNPLTFYGSNTPRVRFREFFTDVHGSTDFAKAGYDISPQNAQMFPWLSRIAANFQEYIIHGMEFWYESTSSEYTANQALGSVILTTQYDVKEKEINDVTQMLNHEFTIDRKPNISFYHPVECNPKQTPVRVLYLRDPSEEVTNMNTYGRFIYATDGNQGTGKMGRIWVTYDIEFLKPKTVEEGTSHGYYDINYGPRSMQPTISVNNALGPSTFVGLLPNPLSTLACKISSVGASQLSVEMPTVGTNRIFQVVFGFKAGASTNFVSYTGNVTRLSISTTNATQVGGSLGSIQSEVPSNTTISANLGMNFFGYFRATDKTLPMYFVPVITQTPQSGLTTSDFRFTIVEVSEGFSVAPRLFPTSPSLDSLEQYVARKKMRVRLAEIEEGKCDSSDDESFTCDMEIPDTNLPVDEHIDRLREELDRALKMRFLEKKASS